jgi:hypothetical protein
VFNYYFHGHLRWEKQQISFSATNSLVFLFLLCWKQQLELVLPLLQCSLCFWCNSFVYFLFFFFFSCSFSLFALLCFQRYYWILENQSLESSLLNGSTIHSFPTAPRRQTQKQTKKFFSLISFFFFFSQFFLLRAAIFSPKAMQN